MNKETLEGECGYIGCKNKRTAKKRYADGLSYSKWCQYHRRGGGKAQRLELTALIDKSVKEARIDELESLSYNKFMHGDWQEVIEDRLTELKGDKEEV